MSEIAIKYDEDTDMSWVATRIEWLALAGKRIAISEGTPDIQALFEQIEDLAAPLYDRLETLQKMEREAAA